MKYSILLIMNIIYNLTKRFRISHNSPKYEQNPLFCSQFWVFHDFLKSKFRILQNSGNNGI